jgi:hypothetical protein
MTTNLEAWIELHWIQFVGTEEEIARAFIIACSHLEAVASALNENPALKQDVLFASKLPTNSKWWIHHEHDIEKSLMEIEQTHIEENERKWLAHKKQFFQSKTKQDKDRK